jgi:predicted amidohydrolase YtcJ
MYADLVLFNGKIHTLDVAHPLASAVAVRDGKIVYVGDDATARAALRPGGEAVDLHSACVVPGLTDAHAHFQMLSLAWQQVNAETPTLQEALDRVAAACAATPPGTWILGYGWNHNVWGGEFPLAEHLDRVAPNHPVSLQAKSGHASWNNSAAFALAGVSASTPDPANGQLVRDAAGRPSGVLLEEAMALVDGSIPEPSLDEVVSAMRSAIPIIHRAGLTGLHDLDGPQSFNAEQVLHRRGELTLRVNKTIPLAHMAEAIGLGLRSGFGDDWLRLGQVKMFADGALGPRTAYMLEGYDTAPGITGIAVTDIEVINNAVHRATAAGLACAIHAIGDRACREVLDVYEEVSAARAALPLPCRIEHVQLLAPADRARLGRLGVVASMQPIHATSDMLIADRHWGRRSEGAYALKTQLNAGAVLALGSDCPVETIDPLAGIHAAVTRRRADGTPGPAGWYPAERLTVEEAVRGYTWGAAYAAGLTDKLGALTPGKLADMTIIEQDIFTIDPMDILHAHVIGTLTGGRFVWRSPELG